MLSGLLIPWRMRAYVGLRGALRKLEALLRIGGFHSVCEAAERVNWAEHQPSGFSSRRN
jgi:hypothetical protein